VTAFQLYWDLHRADCVRVQSEEKMFDAEDWITRLQKAGGNVRIDETGEMRPAEGAAYISPECEAIWKEIQGSENQDKWSQVLTLALAMLQGPIVGWADLPKFYP
jgi:hypothetical protein